MLDGASRSPMDDQGWIPAEPSVKSSRMSNMVVIYQSVVPPRIGIRVPPPPRVDQRQRALEVPSGGLVAELLPAGDGLQRRDERRRGVHIFPPPVMWVWVKMKLPEHGPQVLVHVSIYQGYVLGT